MTTLPSNNPTEIERKFLVDRQTAGQLQKHSVVCQHIEQGYISIQPVIRLRRSNDDYFLTIKGNGLLCRQEFELAIDADEYRQLSLKIDGRLITKRRYRLPLDKLWLELDIFTGDLTGLYLVEIEFPDLITAKAFTPPDYLQREVTNNPAYQNSQLSRHDATTLRQLLN